MTIEEHRRAVRAAVGTARELRVLFGKLGTEEHPRGAVLSAYRNTRFAMRDVMRRNPQRRAVQGARVLDGLRTTVSGLARGMLLQAEQLGAVQAQQELIAYGVELPVRTQIASELQAAHDAWMSAVDLQISGSIAALQMGWGATTILGDEEQIGLLNPAGVVRGGARWLAVIALLAWQAQVDAAQQQQRITFVRQAVAAIDERTTDCCLRVHGQTAGLRKDFRLTGTPRFANRMRDPPFHWWCRTSVCLVRPEDADDALSQAMRDAARGELDARSEAQRHIQEIKEALSRLGEVPDVRIRKGDSRQVQNLRINLRMWRNRERVEIHPAHATSGRGKG